MHEDNGPYYWEIDYMQFGTGHDQSDGRGFRLRSDLLGTDRTKARRWMMMIAGAGFAGLLAGTVWVALFGEVHGTEFSPRRFQRRRFVYYQIPLVGIQVSPVTQVDVTNDLERYLQSAITPGDGSFTERWDLVSISHAGVPVWDGDAGWLCGYLDAPSRQGTKDWLAWSQDNQELADVLWPRVAEVAREDKYFLIPDIMQAASRFNQVEELDEFLRQYLWREYCTLATTMQELGRDDDAIRLFSIAWEQDASSPVPLVGRATSYERRGDAESARIDLELAEKLIEVDERPSGSEEPLPKSEPNEDEFERRFKLSEPTQTGSRS